jgi:hypothetical protein
MSNIITMASSMRTSAWPMPGPFGVVHPRRLLGAERPLQKVDEAGGVHGDHLRGDGGVALGNWPDRVVHARNATTM